MSKQAIWTDAFPQQAAKLRRTMPRKLSAPRRRQPVSKQSRIGRIKTEIYRVLRLQFLERNRWCRVCLFVPYSPRLRAATQVHHSRGRDGTLIIDERFFVPVSDAGHDWIQRNPAAARRAGLLCKRGQWGCAPKDAVTDGLKEMIRNWGKAKCDRK